MTKTKLNKPLLKSLIKALDDMKAMDILTLNVHDLTTITDSMIIASGRSDRQVRALAEKTIETAKESGIKPLGVEGQQQGEWILVDLGDVIVHLMHPTTRTYFQLEKLWSSEHQETNTPI